MDDYALIDQENIDIMRQGIDTKIKGSHSLCWIG